MALPAFRVAQTVSGNSPYTRSYNTTASTGAATKDQFVNLETDGTVNVCDANEAAVLGLATETVGAGEAVNVILATPDVIFSCAVGTGTYAEADIGELRDYNTDGIDLDTGTQEIFIVIGEDETDSGRVLASVNPTKSQGNPGSSVAI